MKKGLVLEGGAMRGMFTAGVLDVLMENNIEFDGAIGVSAGAAFGCNFKSGQIGRAIRYNMKYCRDKRFSGLSCLLKDKNIFSTDFAYGEVPLHLDPFDFDTYQKNPMPFYVVCVDVETGKAVYHDYQGLEDGGFDWIRASASMPIVSQIVEINGQKLLDGGVIDSVAVKYFEQIGFEKNVVILTQPKGYLKKKNSMMPLIKIIYKQYPKLIEAMEHRHLVYNDTLTYIEKLEQEGKAFVIRPDEKLQVSKVEKNPEKLHEIYLLGRQTASRLLPDMRTFLNI